MQEAGNSSISGICARSRAEADSRRLSEMSFAEEWGPRLLAPAQALRDMRRQAHSRPPATKPGAIQPAFCRRLHRYSCSPPLRDAAESMAGLLLLDKKGLSPGRNSAGGRWPLQPCRNNLDICRQAARRMPERLKFRALFRPNLLLRDAEGRLGRAMPPFAQVMTRLAGE